MQLKFLRDLYLEHVGKVSDKWELYVNEYDRLFRDLKSNDISLLEIGIQNGGSLEIYAKYFQSFHVIVGCDVNPQCYNLKYEDERISLVIGDINSLRVFEEISNISNQFDIIIDDGSHKPNDIISTFANYFNLVKKNGMYIVEDMHCSYWQDYESGINFPYSSMAFFKRLADIINFEHWGAEVQRSYLLKGFESYYNISFEDTALNEIHSIEIINSLVVVRKKTPEQNILGKQIVVGEDESVVPGRKVLNGNLLRNSCQENNPWSVSNISTEESFFEQKKQIDELLNEIDSVYNDNLILKKEAENSKDVISNLNKENKDQKQVIQAIYDSSSWRITEPFRLLAYYIKSTKSFFLWIKRLIIVFGGERRLFYKLLSIIIEEKNISLVVKKIKNSYVRFLIENRIKNNNENIGVDLSLVTNGPKISLIIPVYNTPKVMLKEAINSVLNQSYKNWELIIVDDNSDDLEIKDLIKKTSSSHERVKAIFRSRNGNISKALNTGLSITHGDFVAVLDHDDVLDPDALFWVAYTVLSDPLCDYIYTDEDKISKDGRLNFGQFYKPDWSPEYMLAMMYTCHFSVFRSSILKSIGGFRSEFDGAQDYEMTLRFLTKTNKISHIPRVLYHWRVWEESTAQSIDAKPYAYERAQKALIEYLKSKDENFVIKNDIKAGHHKIVFLPKGSPLVSIVIPTANGSIEINDKTEFHIEAVVDSIISKSNYTNYEIIVVHNDNLTKGQIEYLSAFPNLKLVPYRADEFSLSDKINIGSAYACGQYLLILNDDIRVISGDWLDQMVGMIQREGVGVVGPKLLFPDGSIQHAGVVLLGGLPGHAYYNWPNDAEGYGLSIKVNRNYLAVTGACAITPKWLFDRVGGYSKRYPLNYNDIDYCLKVLQIGYRSVYLADVELYHYEGVSKEGGRSVSNSEIQKFLEDWGGIYLNDPFYNPNLNQMTPYQF